MYLTYSTFGGHFVVITDYQILNHKFNTFFFFFQSLRILKRLLDFSYKESSLEQNPHSVI